MKRITINYNDGSISTILCNEFTITDNYEIPILHYYRHDDDTTTGTKVLTDVKSITITL